MTEKPPSKEAMLEKAEKDTLTRRDVVQLIAQIDRLQDYINKYRDKTTGLNHFKAGVQLDKYVPSKLQLGKLRSELNRYKDKKLNDDDIEHFATIRKRIAGYIAEFRKSARGFDGNDITESAPEKPTPSSEAPASPKGDTSSEKNETPHTPDETAAGAANNGETLEKSPEVPKSSDGEGEEAVPNLDESVKISQEVRQEAQQLEQDIRELADLDTSAASKPEYASAEANIEKLDELLSDNDKIVENLEEVKALLATIKSTVETLKQSPQEESGSSPEGTEKDIDAVRDRAEQLQADVQKSIDAYPNITQEPVFEAYQKALAKLSTYLWYDEDTIVRHSDAIQSLMGELELYKQQLQKIAQQNSQAPTENLSNQEGKKETASAESTGEQKTSHKETTRNAIEIHNFRMQALRLVESLEKLNATDDPTLNKERIQEMLEELTTFRGKLAELSVNPSELTPEDIIIARKALAQYRQLVNGGLKLKSQQTEASEEEKSANSGNPLLAANDNIEGGGQTNQEIIDQIKADADAAADAFGKSDEVPSSSGEEKPPQKLLEDLRGRDDGVSSENGSQHNPEATIEESLQQQFGFQDNRLKRLEEQYGIDAVRKTGDYMVIDGVKLKLENHFRKIDAPEFDVARVQELLAQNSANIGILHKRLEAEKAKRGNNPNNPNNPDNTNNPEHQPSPTEGEINTYEQRLSARNIWKEKKEAYEKAYEAYLDDEVARKNNQGVWRSLTSVFRKQEKPETLQALEEAYQNARHEYADILNKALSSRFVGRVSGTDAVKRGLRAGLANRFVVQAVHDKAKLERKFSPEFIDGEGESVPARTLKLMQEVFKKHNAKSRVTGFRFTAGAAAVTAGFTAAIHALHENMPGASISALGATTGAVAGAAIGDGYIFDRNRSRERTIGKIHDSFSINRILEDEARYEKSMNSLERAQRVKKAATVAGGILGAVGASMLTRDFTGDSEVPDTATPPEGTPNSPVEEQSPEPDVSNGPEQPPDDGGVEEVGEPEAPQEQRVETSPEVPHVVEESQTSEEDISYIDEIPATGSIEFTITKPPHADTVSEALYNNWKQHPEVLEGSMSRVEFLNSMYALIAEIDNNQALSNELTEAMRIYSNNIHLVYPNQVIDLKPFYDLMNNGR